MKTLYPKLETRDDGVVSNEGTADNANHDGCFSDLKSEKVFPYSLGKSEFTFVFGQG